MVDGTSRRVSAKRLRRSPSASDFGICQLSFCCHISLPPSLTTISHSSRCFVPENYPLADPPATGGWVGGPGHVRAFTTETEVHSKTSSVGISTETCPNRLVPGLLSTPHAATAVRPRLSLAFLRAHKSFSEIPSTCMNPDEHRVAPPTLHRRKVRLDREACNSTTIEFLLPGLSGLTRC